MKKLSIVTVLCTVTMVQKGTLSYYRSVDYWALILLGLFLPSASMGFGLHSVIYIYIIYIYIYINKFFWLHDLVGCVAQW